MSSIPKKIMFAISDTGGGHRSAAMAIIAALEKKYEVTCSTVDLLRATKFPVLKQAPEIYDYCSKNHLWLNDLFFRNTNSVSRINALTKIVYFQSRHHIEHEFLNTQPDIVVAVHPLVIGLLRQVRKASNATWPIVTVVTDLVTLHASWATPGADLYLVPTQEAFHFLVNHGISSSTILYTGFPIHPKFVHKNLTQEQVRKKLGLASDRFTVLLTGGGVGAGNMGDWVTALETQCPDKQILVVTGNNNQLYNELMLRRNSSHYTNVYGFVNNMETMMAASDIIVSKAGPGTIMESIAIGRPIIITEAVGIQETGNIDYVLKNNLGYYCPTPFEACGVINAVGKKVLNNSHVYRNETVITDGSMLIADTVMTKIDVLMPLLKTMKQECRNAVLRA
ncbi:MAG: glycosyltransferase [Negativicutes bacterium]